MYTIQQSKKFFFYDSAGRQRIFAGVDKARARVLNRAGASVRTIARRSIKNARRKRIGELTEKQRLNFIIRKNIAKREGRPKPKLGYKSSEPGEPPRSRSGLLKKFLYYAFDQSSKSVVVGPAKLAGMDGDAPSILEYGGTSEGVKIKPRPYMRPAEEISRAHHVRLWKDAMM